jgi:hypothetical protein
MSDYEDDNYDDIREVDETYYDTLIDKETTNNISEEAQLAEVLMKSEKEYETELIFKQLAEIEINTRIIEERLAVEKKKRAGLFELVLRRLPYSGINMAMIEEIKQSIGLYKDFINDDASDKIILEKETCEKFKIYLKEIMPKLGETAYSNIICLL